MKTYAELPKPMRDHVDAIACACYAGGKRHADAEYQRIVQATGLKRGEAVALAGYAVNRCLELGYIDMSKLA
jgi:hypothetical protein